LIEAENSSIEENIKWYDKLNAAVASATVIGSFEAQTLAKGAANRQAAINLINKQKAALDELEKKQIGLVVPNAVNPISGGISSTTNIGSGGSSADADKKAQASREKNLEEYNENTMSYCRPLGENSPDIKFPSPDKVMENLI
jgi:hypothetical protein